MNKKIAIVTLGDEKVKNWNRVSFPNKIKYAERHGYAFISCDHLLDDRPPGWSKIILLLQHLSNYDYLFWTDTDSLIIETHIRLESLLSSKHDLTFCVGGSKEEQLALTPNTGAFFVKNSRWSRDFLTTVYDQQFLVNKCDAQGKWVAQSSDHQKQRAKCKCLGCRTFKYDQKAFVHVLHHMLPEEKKKHIACYEPANFLYFNGYGSAYQPGCFLYHLPGVHKNYQIFLKAAQHVREKNEFLSI